MRKLGDPNHIDPQLPELRRKFAKRRGGGGKRLWTSDLDAPRWTKCFWGAPCGGGKIRRSCWERKGVLKKIDAEETAPPRCLERTAKTSKKTNPAGEGPYLISSKTLRVREKKAHEGGGPARNWKKKRGKKNYRARPKGKNGGETLHWKKTQL